MAKISEIGIVGKDGKLHMPMDRLNAFFASHVGTRIIAKFEAQTPGTSEAQQAYYYNYVCPTIQKAFAELGQRMTIATVDRMLIFEYPGDISIGDDRDASYARELRREQMVDFLEWLKQYAAENLSVYIDDPQTI